MLRWLLLLLLFLIVFLYFVLESPATFLSLAKSPLKEMGIEYGSMRGGLLSGFVLEEVNYQNQVQAKEVALKVDLEALKNRVLVVDKLVLKDAHIEKNFLSSLLENNSSKEPKNESNTTLPFDRIVVHQADISLENITYDAYHVNSAMLQIENFDSDMKNNHKGEVTLKLDSNVSKVDLKGRFDNENYNVTANLEAERSFIAPFVKEQNITLLSNPKLYVEAKGNLQELDYKLVVHRLDAKQNGYELHSKRFKTFGHYHIVKKELTTTVKGEVTSNVGDLNLNGDASLNLDDLNNTLVFDVKSDFKPKKSPLLLGLQEQNINIEQFPRVELFAKGDMKEVTFKSHLTGLKATQNELKINLKTFDAKGKVRPLQGDTKVKVSSVFDSSAADGVVHLDASLNFNDLNNTLAFDLDSDLKVHGAYLNPLLADANVTLNGDASLVLLAKGDMNEVNFSTELKGLQGKQNDIAFHLKEVKVKGKTSPLQGDTKVKVSSLFDSSVADGAIHLDSSLNFNDLNNTLAFDLDSDLKVHGTYLNPLLADSNVTLEGDALLSLSAKGDMDEVHFVTDLKEVRGQQNDIAFHLKALHLKGKTKPLQGDTNVVAFSNFDSSVADGRVDLKTTLNFKDVNNSLQVDTIAKLNVHANYVNPLLKEQDMALQGDTPVELRAKGSMEHLVVEFDAKARVLKDNKLSNVTVDSSPIILNLINHEVEGSVKIKSDGEAMGINMESYFSGDYTQPKAMQIKNKIEVGHFNAFGLNLNALQPLAIDLKNGAEGMVLTLDSPKLKLVATSLDNDHYIFKLHTQALQISKILALPSELKKTVVKADIEGEVTLSTQYFNVAGTLAANENFMATIDAQNSESGLVATLFTKHLRVEATGNLEQRDIQANLTIDSLTKVQEEFKELYPFTLVNVDGALQARVTLKGEKVVATLGSKALAFNGFNVEDLNLNVDYADELLTINTFNFNTTGFEDERFNQKFYLNQKGLVHLGKKRDVLLDMHPNILVKATGTSENLEGKFKINKLPLGHPEYGEMIVNCDIDYRQYGLKKEIRGDVQLDKMKLFYESKFLNADYDKDVVIITKRDKHKKQTRDSFLEDTLIDLSIYAPDAKYVTRDIDLEFVVDVNAKKEFGHPLGLLGQVKEINGRVEQPPKLFNVVDSTIVFGGGEEINPLLDIQVEYELPDVLITISIHGNAKRPKITFSSEPPMPKKDILSYLLLGVSTAALAQGEGSVSREAQLFFLNQAARDFAYEVGLDRVFIKDDGTGEGYAVQLGKKINDKTMAIVETSKEGNSFILEYEVNKHIKVEVGQHQKVVPSQSIDIFFRKKFK